MPLLFPSAPCPFQRSPWNPILSAKSVPYPSSLVFNAGVCKFQGRYLMVFRDDVGFSPKGFDPEKTYTHLGIADSSDGIHWSVRPTPWKWVEELLARNPEIERIYDPRLTVVDGRCYLCFAANTRHGLRGGIAVTDDLEHLDLLSLSAPDNRNMVLFPNRIGGDFVRLERPFPEYSRCFQERFDIWISRSPDCRYWGRTELLLGIEDVPYANSKIGPASPPIRTPRGWLCAFHATYKDPSRNLFGWEIANDPTNIWHKEYMVGLMLLDLEDPTKVLGISPYPVMQAEEKYELEGYRGSVLFPGGMILEASGEVKLYYGAADTCECLATADLGDLLATIQPLER